MSKMNIAMCRSNNAILFYIFSLLSWPAFEDRLASLGEDGQELPKLHSKDEGLADNHDHYHHLSNTERLPLHTLPLHT